MKVEVSLHPRTQRRSDRKDETDVVKVSVLGTVAPSSKCESSRPRLSRGRGKELTMGVTAVDGWEGDCRITGRLADWLAN